MSEENKFYGSLSDYKRKAEGAKFSTPINVTRYIEVLEDFLITYDKASKKYPNDQEFGKAVRQIVRLYNDEKLEINK